MKKEKASSSAEFVAVFRAIESMKSPNERVCVDPFAKCFIRPLFRFLLKSLFLSKSVLWFAAERRYPGAVGNLVARVRHIDDYLKSCIDDGIEQLVILGAGYDTRAYRFDGLKEQVNVFEVDHPVTQRVKVEKIKKVFGSLPHHVVYVPMDFEKESLNKGLSENGYDKALKTLFIWEGVTYYLPPKAVDDTLAFISKNSGKGSSVIFDYIFESVVNGTSGIEIAKKMFSYHAKNEPWIFGIEYESVEGFLLERGFYKVKNVTSEFLKGIYFKGKNEKRKVYPFFGHVHATVNIH
jgi:methyltransferase (TIGR00027 family)